MKLGEKQEIFTSNLVKLITFAESKGYKCRLKEVQRTPEQQDIYLAKGVSKTKNSKHLDCLAGDIYFTKGGVLIEAKNQLQFIGDYWESLHSSNRWGGNFKTLVDCPHFEFNA